MLIGVIFYRITAQSRLCRTKFTRAPTTEYRRKGGVFIMDMVVFDILHGMVVKQQGFILDLWKAWEREVDLDGSSCSQ